MSTGVEVKITNGTTEVVRGITGYTVNEESTPIDPSDTTGAAGTIDISFFVGSTTPQRLKRYARKHLDLEDLGMGKTSGTVRVPTGSTTGGYSLKVDLETALLSVNRQAQPFNGMLTGYVGYVLGLVGITTGYTIDPSYDFIPVAFPGWNDEVWLKLKQLASAFGAEISFVSNRIEFRPLRGRTASNKRETEISWAMDDTQLAQAVDGYWYKTEYKTNALAYPPGGWTPDVRVETVDAGEVIEFEVELESSVSSVQQPTIQTFVSRNHTASSVYAVAGSDGLPIVPAQWIDKGGSLTVEIGDDTRTLVVRVRGADIPDYAPFSIAVSAGPSDMYSSLRIVGTGVFFQRNYLKLYTGIGPELTSREIGATVDDPFITSLSMLQDRMAWTLARYGGARHTFTANTMGINRDGDPGFVYPTFDDFDAWATAEGLTDFDDLDTEAAAQGWTTFDDFDAWWNDYVSQSFANQAFGNTAGARVFRYGLWLRIRTAQISAGSVGYTAENDTIMDDFDTFAADHGLVDFDDFDAFYDGMMFDDFDAAPLEIWEP